ncbi:hypothetical protein FACS1894151_10190 [Spirochaetia bacterium]|nr:hypothetical protein FACS1894151_10190 [Spirochaetia bacterium]
MEDSYIPIADVGFYHAVPGNVDCQQMIRAVGCYEGAGNLEKPPFAVVLYCPAVSGGGDVFVSGASFSKSGGVIYGSNAEGDQANRAKSDSDGHAVSAGTKKRNTTVRAATAMDSTKDGPAGGWE